MTETHKAGGAPGARTAIMASAGAAVEWYDFFIYGTAAALVFPQLFFPADLPPVVSQLASFSTFAVGFLARPLGGIVFGHFGDTYGRKRALVAAMFIMGVSTTLIGLLPSYADIGYAAPLALVALRFAQGIAVGGQWGGAALLAIESAPANRRGFYGSFVQVGVPLGLVAANLILIVVSSSSSDADFMSWGWRIGFVLSVALILIGVMLHRHVPEPDHKAEDASRLNRSPLLDAMIHHWREVLLAGGAFVANNVAFYIAVTYAVAYGSTAAGLDRDLVLGAVMAGSALMIPALLACGAASDRFGRRGVFLAGAIASGLWAFALFPLIESGSPVAVYVAISVQLLFVSMMYGPQAALFAELFPPSVRYSGASMGYQIGAVVGGGFAPIIATALHAEFRSSTPVAIYLSATCAVSFVCVILLGFRNRRSIGHEAAS